MGKDDKEDSGFGFKDRAKAEETLKLLEQHDMNYRRLTVRGLLGRAKRVLGLTKAEEKIKNIKEAMEVFENWLAEQSQAKEPVVKKKEAKEKNADSDEKSSSGSDVEMADKSKESPPSDTVQGLGFKDRSAAEDTLKELEGRDPDYQKLAVKGLVGRAKRVLTCTKDKTKISNIEAAIGVFDKFLDDFDTEHRSKKNNTYLSLGVVTTCLRTAEERGLDVEHQKAFVAAYSKVGGEYKKLRTVPEKEGGKSWDIVRNTALEGLKGKYADSKLFNEKDEPTDDHLRLLLWAYSPEAAKVKKVIQETKPEVKESRKRKSSVEDESPSKKAKD